MLDVKKLQEEIFANKIKRHFPTDNIEHEFSLLKDEVKEAEEVLYDKEKFSDELADIAIYAMSLAKIVGIDLEASVLKKIEYNKNRTHKPGTYVEPS